MYIYGFSSFKILDSINNFILLYKSELEWTSVKALNVRTKVLIRLSFRFRQFVAYIFELII